MRINKLVELDGKGNLVIRPEALALPAYAALWNRDKSPDKEIAIMELTYIWYMYSVDKYNPYKEYIDLDDRDKHIRLDLVNRKYPTWKKDKIVVEAGELYKKHNYDNDVDTLLTYLKALDKIKRFADDVDYNEVDEYGKPKHKPRDTTAALKDVAMLYKNITEYRKIVQEGLDVNETRVRGGVTKGMFEDE